MATTPGPNDYNIPGLSQQPFTSDGKAASPAFIRIWLQMRNSVITALNGIQGQVTSLAAIVRTQAQQQAQIAAQNTTILAQQALILTALGIGQSAAAAANDAQTTADAAGGGTARSGSSTNPAVNVSSTVGWTPGPVVSLAGVSAGNLTITGTGPQQDDDVAVTITNIFQTNFTGQYRVVEVIGGVDGATFGPFNFSVGAISDPPSPGSYSAAVNNSDASTVAAFSTALATTGAIDYRIDFIKVSGPSVTSLLAYLYVRRS